MSNIIEITSAEEFEKEINSDVPVIVDFYATWCNPCRLQAPILHDFKEEMGEKVKILKVDVDVNEQVAFNLNIASIPTLHVYKNGQLLEKTVGLTPKASLAEMIIKHL